MSVNLNANYDYANDAADALEAVLVARFLSGEFPHARRVKVENVIGEPALVPAGVEAKHTVVEGKDRYALSEGEGWLVHAHREGSGKVWFWVVAEAPELAEKLATELKDAIAVRQNTPTAINVGFWHHAHNKADLDEREIEAPQWPAIRHNYAASVVHAFDRLVEFEGDEAGGRLLLLHGPPGTGKTTALRALANAWRGWCRFEVVIDAELLFGNAGYLMKVLIGEDDRDEDKWRLLVLEDCDELLRADAKARSGQALGRLLNVTDGFLGQGRKLMVALSTNEPLSVLHPAVARPGRCLAEVHVDRLSRAEAAKWLGDGHTAPPGGASLAELYALKDGDGPVRAPALKPVSGTYL